MANKPPFLEDGSQHGVSRTQFRHMRKAEKREAMIDWFHANFEDPAENTSYSTGEGGYLWNYGGPHDASEELYEKFDGIASQALIEEVIFEVQRDGILEWAPACSYDYDPADVSPDQLAFDFYTDQPTEKYGSAEDRFKVTRFAKYHASDKTAFVGCVPIVSGQRRNSSKAIDYWRIAAIAASTPI